MQLKNRLFFSIAYYLCKSSHFGVFVQNICAIWPCFHRIQQTALLPSASLHTSFHRINDLPAAFLFCVSVLSDDFSTRAASFLSCFEDFLSKAEPVLAGTGCRWNSKHPH